MTSVFKRVRNVATAFSGTFAVAGRSADDLWNASTRFAARSTWNGETMRVYRALQNTSTAESVQTTLLRASTEAVNAAEVPSGAAVTALRMQVVADATRKGDPRAVQRLASDLVNHEYIPHGLLPDAPLSSKLNIRAKLDDVDQGKTVDGAVKVKKLQDGAYLVEGGKDPPGWFNEINDGNPVIVARTASNDLRVMRAVKNSDDALNVVKSLISNKPGEVYQMYRMFDAMPREEILIHFDDAIQRLARNDTVNVAEVRKHFDYKEFLSTAGKGYRVGGGKLGADGGALFTFGDIFKAPRIRPDGRRWKNATADRVDDLWKEPSIGMSMCRRSSLCADMASFLTVAGLTAAAAVLAVNTHTCGKATIVPGACDDAGAKDGGDKDDDWGARYSAAMSTRDSETCFTSCMPTTWDDRNPDAYASPPKYRTFESLTAQIVSEKCGSADDCDKDAYEKLLDKGDNGYLGMQPFCSAEHDEPLGECREYCLAQCANTPPSYQQLYDELVKAADARDRHNATQIGLIALGIVVVAAILAYFFLSGKKSDASYEEELWGDMRDES